MASYGASLKAQSFDEEHDALLAQGAEQPKKKSASSVMAVAALGLALVGTALLVASSNNAEKPSVTGNRLKFDEVRTNALVGY